jgi:hypothetical protein
MFISLSKRKVYWKVFLMMRKQNCWNVLHSPFQYQRLDDDDDYTSLMHDEHLTVFDDEDDDDFDIDYIDDEDRDIDSEVVMFDRTHSKVPAFFESLPHLSNQDATQTASNNVCSVINIGTPTVENDYYQSNNNHGTMRVSPEVSPCSLKVVKRHRLSPPCERVAVTTNLCNISYQKVLPMLQSMDQSEETRKRILEQLPWITFSNRDPSRFYSTQETREILLSIFANSQWGITSP